MALKKKSDFGAAIGTIISKNETEIAEKRETKRVGQSSINDELAEYEEQIRKRVALEMKKKTRTMQRSLRLDKHINDWLDNVKKYQKEEQGIKRPCLDDLMYDAIVEYLKGHYSELEP